MDVRYTCQSNQRASSPRVHYLTNEQSALQHQMTPNQLVTSLARSLTYVISPTRLGGLINRTCKQTSSDFILK